MIIPLVATLLVPIQLSPSKLLASLTIYFRFIPTIGVYVRGPKVRVSKRNEEYWSISIGRSKVKRPCARTYVRSSKVASCFDNIVGMPLRAF